MDEALLKRQAERAKEYMSAQDPDNILTYHNWQHVSNVLKAAKVLSEDCSEEERLALCLAAIWHDADYANGAEEHEQRSADIALKSLSEEGLSEELKNRVYANILATKMTEPAKDKCQRIIKDADLAHLAAKEYFLFSTNLQIELNAFRPHKLSDEAWLNEGIKFMKNTKYHSLKGKELYMKGKEENLKTMLEMQKEGANSTGKELTKEQKKALKKERKKHEPKFNAEKGIETMFRVSLRNHINLSRIADDKANTLISVNAIILSIVLSALFPQLSSNTFLLYPGISLILVSILTIIIATLSTIPKTTHGNVSKEDVQNKKGNLLFFGNFHSMSLKEYEWGIGELMKDGEYLYGSLTRDLYFLGKVLHKKYSYLRSAYLIFVIGLIISILLFVWSITNPSHGLHTSI